MDRRAAVRDTYDRIASHFASTREYTWPEIDAFVADRQGTIGLDLGCGNCRHAELLADRTDRVLGIDISRNVLETGRERAADRSFAVDLVQGEGSRIPVQTGTVDLAVYVATLHHLPTRDARIQSLDDLARVLSADGRGLVSVWSTTHDRFEETAGFDTTVEWTLPDGETVDRFYHIYDPEEFEDDLAASALEIVDWELASGNCYAEVRPAEDG